MKFSNVIPVCLGVILLASSAPAQTKIAYVDIDRVTSKAKPVNSLMNDIQGQIEVLQKEIDAKRKQAAELDADIKRSDGVLAKEEVDKKRKELMRLQNDLDDLRLKGEKKMREVDQTVFEPVLKKILFCIQDIAKEQKIDIVLRGEAVLYGTSGVDISDAVIKKLNSDNAATSGTRAAAKTEPAATPEPAPAEAVATPAATIAPIEKTPAAPKATRKTDAARKTTPAESKRPVDRQKD